MSTELDIYFYPETTGYDSSVELVTIHYEAGKYGLQSISPLTYPIRIETTDAVNAKFSTVEEGFQHYFDAAAAIIVSAVSVATGETHTLRTQQRWSQKDNPAFTDIYSGLGGLSSTILSNYSEEEGDNAALGIALADHATENVGTFAAIDTALSGKSDVGHSHIIADVTGLQTALDAKAAPGDITTAINALVNGAGAAYDTLKELKDFITADESTASALAITVGNKVDKVSGKGLSTEDYSTAEKTKLSGIATGATNTAAPVNADWNSGSGLSQIQNKPNIAKAVVGTSVKTAAFPIFKEATVSSGSAVFHLTADGLSTGTALFSTVYTESVNCFVSDAMASYQMAGTFSNSNKTLTITTNKLGTANILTGILGQVAGNGAVVKLSVWGE